MTLRVVTFKIEPELLELLDLVARELGTTRSELLRRAVRRYVESYRPARGRVMEVYRSPRIRASMLVREV